MKRSASLAVFAGVIAVLAYAFVAIFTQPAASGSNEMFNGIPGQSGTDDSPQHRFVTNYVDGGVTTLVTSVANRGLVGLTITGVESFPSDWQGLIKIEDARAAVLAGPNQCCELDESATWSAHDFRPIYVGPGHEGVVALHIVMTNCEFNGAGLLVGIDYITVDYTVLGFPHSQKVGIQELWFKSPGACLRPGPARTAS